MKATVKQLFNEVSGSLNARTNEVSSLGDYVSPTTQRIVDQERIAIMKVVDPSSLAYKIIDSCPYDRALTDKQLWVISYELLKNEEYSAQVAECCAKEAKIANAKRDERKSKLSANKSESQSVLDLVKKSGKLLKDYYAFVKSTKMFAKEFYSKKFTEASAIAFINL